MIAGAGGLGMAAPMGGMSGLGINGGLNGPLGGGSNAPLPGLNATPLSGAATMQLQQLSQLIEGFTSAEILMALMIAAASSKRKEDDGSGALALLAGMALAGQMNGVQGLGGCGGMPGFAPGGAGGMLNAMV